MNIFEAVVGKPDAGVIRINLIGDLDYGQTGLLEEAVGRAEKATKWTRMEVDLRALRFMDSTGLAALLRALQRANERGYRFAIVNPAAAPLAVLRLTGTLGVLSGDAA